MGESRLIGISVGIAAVLVIAIPLLWFLNVPSGRSGLIVMQPLPQPKPVSPGPPIEPVPPDPARSPTVEGLIEDRNRLAGELAALQQRLRDLQAELARIEEDAAKQPKEKPAPPNTGQGRVVDLVAGGEAASDPEEEQRRRREWESRIRKDNEAAVARLADKLELDDYHAGQLRAVLEDELRERSRILDEYSRGRMGLDAFREAVTRNRDAAKARLRALLDEEQWEKYQHLPPTQQVLTSGLAREQ